MNDFCPDCGTHLKEARDCKAHWIRALLCPTCQSPGFLEVADNRWIYPLQRLERGVLDSLIKAEDSSIRKAASLLNRVDYKTISIVDFESHLLEDRNEGNE